MKPNSKYLYTFLFLFVLTPGCGAYFSAERNYTATDGTVTTETNAEENGSVEWVSPCDTDPGSCVSFADVSVKCTDGDVGDTCYADDDGDNYIKILAAPGNDCGNPDFVSDPQMIFKSNGNWSDQDASAPLTCDGTECTASVDVDNWWVYDSRDNTQAYTVIFFMKFGGDFTSDTNPGASANLCCCAVLPAGDVGPLTIDSSTAQCGYGCDSNPL